MEIDKYNHAMNSINTIHHATIIDPNIIRNV